MKKSEIARKELPYEMYGSPNITYSYKLQVPIQTGTI